MKITKRKNFIYTVSVNERDNVLHWPAGDGINFMYAGLTIGFGWGGS